MALIKCPECQKEISDQSKACPNCGYRLNTMSDEDKSKLKKIILACISIVLVVILIVVICDVCIVTTEELSEQLRKSKEELKEIQNEIDDLEREKYWNDWAIENYGNED